MLSILLSCAVLAAPQNAQKKPDPIVPPLDREKLAVFVEGLARTAVEEEGVPGLTIAVAEAGQVILAKGFGYADAARALPAKADTRYPIGSLTRQFTATAVLQLVDAEKLGLDDELGKLLPGFPVGGSKVTVRHLLSNTSGIPAWSRILAKHPEAATKELDEKAFFALFADVPFEFEPGADFRLDSANYVLLSMIVARVSGEPFTDYVTKHVLEPVGLVETRFCPPKDRPVGYASDCRIVSDDSELEMPLPSTPSAATQSLCSTVGDLVLWQQALVDRAVFSERASRLFMTPTTLPDGNSTNYGYAIRMSRLGEFKSYSHTGGVGGFRVRSAYYSLPHYTIVVLANCASAPVERIERDIANFLLGTSTPGTTEVALADEEARRAAGVYQIATTQVRILHENGSLWFVTPIEPRVRLVHLGGLVFAFENDKDARVTFVGTEGKCSAFTILRGGFETRAKRMDG